MATSRGERAERESTRGDAAGRLSRLLVELAAAPSIPVAPSSEEPLRPGERLHRFEIRAVLGRGGFGTVYEAWDGELGRAVALKTLRVVGARAGASAAAIKLEAEAVAKLNHPGIVTLHDVCLGEGGCCLVMERLEGMTLSERLRSGPLPWKEAVRIASEMAEALAHAHQRGVLHRDLKPGNVFLCEGGRVKLLDFGLAHLLGTACSSSGGTPAYMAPEQLRGEDVDGRADVFALGAVLAEMIAGELPYGAPAGGAAGAEERGVPAGGTPPRLPGAPARLARLVGRMLARDPAGRPAGGAAAAAELAALRRAVEARRSRAWIAGTLVACAVAIAAAMALRPARLPAGRLVVAMADLDNRTGDPNLDGLGELLGAALEQSRRVALMDRDTVLRFLTEGGAQPPVIGEAEAVAAARAATAQLVIVPSLRPAPGGFELAVQVVDLLRGRSIFGAREKAVAQEGLYAATDRLASRVRKALSEEASEAPRRPVRVAEFAPANPEALRLYAEGERLNSEYDYEGAKAKWEAAIALDPSFPLPRLSLLHGLTGVYVFFLDFDREAALEHARALRRDLARLPEGLRPWAETVILDVEDAYANHTEYLAALDGAIAARPEQPAPYIAAANELLLRRGDAEAARPYVDRAVQVSPLAGLGDVMDYLVLMDRLDEALEQGRRWTERAPALISFQNLCMVHLARGEHEQALQVSRAAEERWGIPLLAPYLETGQLEIFDAALERAPPYPLELRWMEGEELASRGRVRDGLTLLGGMPDAAREPDEAGEWLTAKAAVLLVRGDRRAVEEAVAEATRVAGPKPLHAWILALAGNVEQAIVRGRPAPDRLLAYRMARALHEWKTGSAEAALAELSSITSPASDFHRGEILAELGRHRDAVEAYRRYRRLRHGDMSTPAARLDHWLHPRSLYLEATSLEALGDRDEAREVLGRLLRLWARADPDVPLLAEANALEQKLRSVKTSRGRGGDERRRPE